VDVVTIGAKRAEVSAALGKGLLMRRIIECGENNHENGQSPHGPGG
jgi:hypothetical protein